MSRPKGYAPWNPKPDTQALIRAVKQVLREYENHLPLTVRQVFYRLVGTYGYDKTEKAYSRLCEHLVRARRAQMISFEHIRDDGTTHHPFAFYRSPEHFWEEMLDHAENYQRDKMDGQPVAIELWCEAAGMVPQLERVANRFSVPVYSTGGFSSVTVTYEIAERALARDVPTVFLHCGDFDPSGESIFEAQTKDAVNFLRQKMAWKGENDGWPDHVMEAFTRPGEFLLGRVDMPDGYPDLIPTRVALTEDQVEEYGLPTAPPKSSDTRSVNWGSETCQLEALPPNELADIVEGAIEQVLDGYLLADARQAEWTERRDLSSHITELIAGNE